MICARKKEKKITEDESDTDYTVLKIVGQFNKKVFNKNQLIKNISLIVQYCN